MVLNSKLKLIYMPLGMLTFENYTYIVFSISVWTLFTCVQHSKNNFLLVQYVVAYGNRRVLYFYWHLLVNYSHQ